MTNGKVQAEKGIVEAQLRKSRIHKGIARTLNTAKYESIVIEDHIDEEIEWSTLEERDKKINNWETILITRYKQFHDRVMNELGLEHKVAYFKESEPDYRNEPGTANELDDLDGLG
jgi:anthranilate/para-aminobenzoate synthase component II